MGPWCVTSLWWIPMRTLSHYNDVIMSAMASQITSLTIVYSNVYSRCRSTKTSKLRVTGLCAGNSPVTSEFPAQRASDVENVSIWWRNHILWEEAAVQLDSAHKGPAIGSFYYFWCCQLKHCLQIDLLVKLGVLPLIRHHSDIWGQPLDNMLQCIHRISGLVTC